MLYKLLNARKPGRDFALLADYEALYRGGACFRARIANNFLRPDFYEPSEYYQERVKEAHYRNYLGPIVDYFASYLFSAPIEIRAFDADGEKVESDDFYAQFKEDCDRCDSDLMDFMRVRCTDAMIKGMTGWIVQLPSNGGVPAADKADFDTRGLGEASLCAVDGEHVFDWECDDDGLLLWVIVHSTSLQRSNPKISERAAVTETWRVYDRQNVETFEVTYDPTKPPQHDDDIPSKGGPQPHGFSRVPVVLLCIEPEGLWLANRIASACVEHFRLSNLHAWGLRKSALAMPVFKIREGSRPPLLGRGRFWTLGVDESMEWSVPPADAFNAMREELSSLKDEIYRIVHQMALGVENNAAAVGRSGQSKEADGASTEVVLRAYGSLIQEAIEETYQIISDGRGEDLVWSIDGFERFNVADAASMLANATAAKSLSIPSETFNRRMFSQVAEAMLPGIDQPTKDKIREEIEVGVQESMARSSEMESVSHEAQVNALKSGATEQPQGKPFGNG